ncbi:hypothetical protein [Mangrovimonas spongiae]|uniref:Chromosome partitioning protein ParA n=1 Tax=Mangrovimonas spongiae TaxID=2494697 RepID=A0A428K5U6_9FLAO|nr:hypothetical protein [Mangrovimonas spongiae]RSK41766.1 hypothetical protein EJA19_02485 [Mangrovimonas spongiae]
MIVTPQLFNYRLIIGTLLFSIVALGSYSLANYNALKEQQDFLEQERSLVQSELTEIITLYETLSLNKNILQSDFKKSKQQLLLVQDSLNIEKANVASLSKYKARLSEVKKQNKALFTLIDSLERVNKNLKQTIQSVEALQATSIKAEALRTVSLNAIYPTNKADKADHIKVCFNLKNNTFVPEGNKTIYVQILDPNHQVIAGKGVASFNDKSLAYSGKTTVNNLKREQEVCAKIDVNKDSKLIKGDYLVSIFQESYFLGKTQLKLN